MSAASRRISPWWAAPVVVALGAAADPRLGALLALWLAAWRLNAWLAARDGPAARRIVPAIFGVTLIALWELAVRLFAVPPAILPAPSAIGAALARQVPGAGAELADPATWPPLWQDVLQTVVKGALTGWAIGCAAAVALAVAIDRSPFLQRGLIPVGNFMAALPVVGIAPILVMWFGFDWQSKAAVVVVMVFFPVLVNTLEGLRATDPMQRDLMRTWGAGHGATLARLRLPAAMPFIFNGLKIATTLALIGAIVAEFFGSPTRGMGFRISTELGRLALDMVWAEITVAALAGSAFYGAVALVERAVTFWHPAQRGRER